MRIESSSVAMASARSYQEEASVQQITTRRHYNGDNQLDQKTVTESTVKTTRSEQEAGAALYAAAGVPVAPSEQSEASNRSTQSVIPGKAASAAPQGAVLQQAGGSDWLSDIMDSINNDPKIQMLRKCLELLERATGKDYTVDLKLGNRTLRGGALGGTLRVSADAVSLQYAQTAARLGGASPAPQRAQGENPNGFWTRQTVSSGFVKGSEHTSFSSTGSVVTADGRTISFGVNVEMSRSFEMAFASETKEEVYTDPLVINLGTDAAALSDVTFYFDLNCDGTAEELSALDGASGFLALDKNGDGTVNDGSELFGALSGDGFGELAQYDQDGNGWIDENDEVFSRLSVWVRCGSGEAKLLSLAEADVGAIFLGSQATRHTLADSYGQEGAVVRRTGLYLRESGSVGTVQHLDFKA